MVVYNHFDQWNLYSYRERFTDYKSYCYIESRDAGRGQFLLRDRKSLYITLAGTLLID